MRHVFRNKTYFRAYSRECSWTSVAMETNLGESLTTSPWLPGKKISLMSSSLLDFCAFLMSCWRSAGLNLHRRSSIATACLRNLDQHLTIHRLENADKTRIHLSLSRICQTAGLAKCRGYAYRTCVAVSTTVGRYFFLANGLSK